MVSYQRILFCIRMYQNTFWFVLHSWHKQNDSITTCSRYSVDSFDFIDYCGKMHNCHDPESIWCTVQLRPWYICLVEQWGNIILLNWIFFYRSYLHVHVIPNSNTLHKKSVHLHTRLDWNKSSSLSPLSLSWTVNTQKSRIFIHSYL